MTACDDRLLELHALLDGELDAVNAAAAETHLKGCANCVAEFDRLVALRGLLQEPALRFEVPAILRARIARSLPDAMPTAPPSRFVWAALGAGTAVAASMLLMVAVPQSGMQRSGIEQQLVGSHVRSLLANHLVDVVTSDRHVVRPWFNGRIDFSPPTPDLSAQGFPLAGGRLDYIDGRVVPAIVYRRRLHTINLFAWPEGRAQASKSAHFDGYNIRHWERGGLEFWAISDVPDEDMELFQRAFDEAA